MGTDVLVGGDGSDYILASDGNDLIAGDGSHSEYLEYSQEIYYDDNQDPPRIPANFLPNFEIKFNGVVLQINTANAVNGGPGGFKQSLEALQRDDNDPTAPEGPIIIKARATGSGTKADPWLVEYLSTRPDALIESNDSKVRVSGTLTNPNPSYSQIISYNGNQDQFSIKFGNANNTANDHDLMIFRAQANRSADQQGSFAQRLESLGFDRIHSVTALSLDAANRSWIVKYTPRVDDEIIKEVCLSCEGRVDETSSLDMNSAQESSSSLFLLC